MSGAGGLVGGGGGWGWIRNPVTQAILVARALQVGGNVRPGDAVPEDLLPLDALTVSLMNALIESGGRVVVVIDPERFGGEGWSLRWDPGAGALIAQGGGEGVVIRVTTRRVKVGDGEEVFAAVIITPFKPAGKSRAGEEGGKSEEEEEEEEEDGGELGEE